MRRREFIMFQLEVTRLIQGIPARLGAAPRRETRRFIQIAGRG
jgi:hypothetical protein